MIQWWGDNSDDLNSYSTVALLCTYGGKLKPMVILNQKTIPKEKFLSGCHTFQGLGGWTFSGYVAGESWEHWFQCVDEKESSIMSDMFRHI